MLKTTTLLFFVVINLMPAQNESSAAKEKKYYHLDFVVKELESGKVTNSRSYSMILSTENAGIIRVGSRLPVTTSSSGGNTQFSYIDLGVSIDCSSLRELQNELAHRVSADISSVAPRTEQASTLPPVIRQNKWTSDVIIPIKKPSLLFSSDDPVTKGKIQLEVTATPVK